MVPTSNDSPRVYFSVEEFRGDELTIICGLRRLEPDEPPHAPFVMAVSSQVAAEISDIVGLHLQSPNYHETTTRLVGMIVGTADPIEILRANEDGSLSLDRAIDESILRVEIAGPKASRAEREQFDSRILVYPPREVRTRPKPRPWWKLW
ncbi:MAG: hypothetical protein JWP89_1200 [Schlesneria sp.]|nr:hypothetical protein [Schlesneria sp.]